LEHSKESAATHCNVGLAQYMLATADKEEQDRELLGEPGDAG
jgi:hypothetical protein